jgi:hypothetical protein
MSGNITYEVEEQRSFSVDSEVEYDVNVISVNGQLSGEAGMFGEPFLEASATIGGFTYETVDGASIVREDTDVLVNATMLSGLDKWAILEETKTISVYSPPYIDGFDPDSVDLGSGWTVTGSVNKTVTIWENGVTEGPRFQTEDATHTVVLGSYLDTKSTPAGQFRAVKLVITSPDRYEIRWWSDEVNGYVEIDVFSETEDSLELTQTLSLSEHVEGDSDSVLWIVLVGVVVAAVASAVLVAVVLRMRSPKGS